MKNKIEVLATNGSADYELIDSGEGEKLERYGQYLLARPDPQALWAKRQTAAVWKKADAYFIRDSDKAEWTFRGQVPPEWPIDFGGLRMLIKPSAFKHTGLFPEQAANWDWLRQKIAGHGEVEVLNLFGYTGGASLACAAAGAKVVHIDGSRAAVTWARENAALSGLAEKPIRWIIEDARIFVEREIRRGRHYDGIIMDPPAFGHGPDKELWKIEEDLLPLINSCQKLLKPEPLFFLINGYAAGYSAVAYENMLRPLQDQFGGHLEIGELTLAEKDSPRLLPCGIFARWSAK